MTPKPEYGGRELDAKIAMRVMGFWDVQEFEGDLVHGENNMNGWPMPTPHYSTDIASAFLVVEAMRAKEYGFVIGGNGLTTKQNGVKFFRGISGIGHSIFDAEPHDGQYSVGESIPLCICLAALRTLDAQLPEKAAVQHPAALDSLTTETEKSNG